MDIRSISIAAVEIGPRLRALDPAWVELLAESIAADGQTQAIQVVARGNGFVLIDGARRLAALAKLGRETVEARVEPESALAEAAFVRLGEIQGNLIRAGLTVLDRAYYIAAWREVYESAHTLKRRGPRPSEGIRVRLSKSSAAGRYGSVAEAFSDRFTVAAQRALKLDERSVQRALVVARIDPALGRRLTGHPCADNQSELLSLAREPAERQAAIVGLLAEGKAATVARAVDMLDGRTALAPTTPAERMHEKFARLSEAEKFVFFDRMSDELTEWLSKREAKARAKPRPALHVVR